MVKNSKKIVKTGEFNKSCEFVNLRETEEMLIICDFPSLRLSQVHKFSPKLQIRTLVFG
jgi:hypothetical protein